ncbi:deoxyribonuclease IV [Mycoplasmopsis phocirhinis]|uniref:Probable endonuclease 4 n=1 Tax=Mycoplasmopsis phocirhinis TaxID=142650 RepID=A0A4P6MS96_9BACT|nr:deoxyribonuclease IV [Mycoplasmopsis phocirhinis]QBF34721.1 deoxyribonuclease IV [Mycoplasmopsis phocirhinis]
MIKLGSHVQFKAPDYLLSAAKDSIDYGANTMMIYVGPPQSTKRVAKEKFNVEKYNEMYADKIKNQDIIVHAPYIINMASVEKGKFASDFLIEEIKRVAYIGAKYIVLHPGAHTKFDINLSIETLIQNLIFVLEQTKDLDVIICLETMAGKGTEIFTNFEQMKYILEKCNSDRIQLCLDTCHIWDAGYNVKNYDEFKILLQKYDLQKYVKVIHLNDSKNDINSHKDRHANIGEGYIGLKTLATFVHDKDWDNIPIILETPWTEQGPIYKKEIQELLNSKNQ